MIQSVRSRAAAALAAMAMILAGPAVAGTSDAENSRPLQVIDANGKVVGRLNGKLVVMNVSGETIQVALRTRKGAGGLAWEAMYASVRMYFQTADCTGPAYLSSDAYPSPFGTAPASIVSGRSGTHLYVGHSDKLKRIDSTAAFMDRHGRCVAGGSSEDRIDWVLDPPIDLDSLYAPPMRVR
jgi:hypothetical protein